MSAYVGDISDGVANGAYGRLNLVIEDEAGDAARTAASGLGSINISGTLSYNFNADTTIANSSITASDISFSGDVNYTLVSATTVNTLSGSDASTSLTLTGSLTVNDESDYAGALLINGDAEINGDMTNLSSLTLYKGSLTVGEGVTVSDALGDTNIGDKVALNRTDMYGFTLNVGAGSVVDSGAKMFFMNGSDFTLTGSGVFEVESIVLTCGTTASTDITIESGATMHITGSNSTSLTESANDYAFVLGHFSNGSDSNLISISGSLIVDAALSTKLGNAALTVNRGGLLQLNSGLDLVVISGGTSGSANASSITVQDGGTLALGNGAQESDGDTLNVTMEGGSTIKATAVEGGIVNVYEDINYSGTINFDGTSATLAMHSEVLNESGTANIIGSVEFAGNATLGSVVLADTTSALTISSDVTSSSLSNAGTVDITSEGSLSMGTTGEAISITAKDGEAKASIVLEEGASLSESSISKATISNANIVVGGVQQSSAQPSSASVLDATVSFDATWSSTTLTATETTINNDASLLIKNSVISGGSSFTIGSSAGLTVQDTSISVSTADGNFSLDCVSDASNSSAVLNISGVFNGEGSVTLDGTIWVRLSLTADEFELFQSYWEDNNQLSIVFDGIDELSEGSEFHFSIDSVDDEGNYMGREFELVAGPVGANGELEFTVVPEPSTATLSLLALTALLARRKRRQA